MLPGCRAFIREKDVGDRLKSVLFMSEALPDHLLRSAPLLAIAVPVINRSGAYAFRAGRSQDDAPGSRAELDAAWVAEGRPGPDAGAGHAGQLAALLLG